MIYLDNEHFLPLQKLYCMILYPPKILHITAQTGTPYVTTSSIGCLGVLYQPLLRACVLGTSPDRVIQIKIPDPVLRKDASNGNFQGWNPGLKPSFPQDCPKYEICKRQSKTLTASQIR